METSNPIEAIDDRCRELDDQIEQSEKNTAQLKERRRKLQDARAVLLDELGLSATAGGSVARAPSVEEVSSTLREVVLQYVKEHAGSEGISASEVTTGLSDRRSEKVTPRVFYSMVYLTLMRLTETEELKFKKGPRGRLFMPYVKRVRLIHNEPVERAL